MTKFCLMSDVHLAFGPLAVRNTENADCLILAGDIAEFCELHPKSELSYNKFDDFFSTVSSEFKHVVYIAGNHEYYGFTIEHGKQHINNYLESMNIGNIKFLNNDSVDIDGVMVHGATNWTNFNNGDWSAMESARLRMNDYRYIKNSDDEYLTPTIALQHHLESMNFLRSAVSDNKRCVVVTHHAPLYNCIDSGHSSGDLDHAYASDLGNFILDNNNIAAWCFGHTHGRVDFMCGNTRIMSNCRGYHRYEKISMSFEPKYFEV